MSEDKKNSFDKISDALDTDYVSDDDNFESKIERFQDKKNQLVERANDSDITLEDAEYMKMELKTLINSGYRVLEKLDQDILIGTKVRSHEVFFSGINSLRDTIKELRELNKTIAELKLEKEKMNNNSSENKTVNNFFDGKQLLDMLKTAQLNNSMKEVKAEFKVDEGDSTSINYRNDKIKK